MNNSASIIFHNATVITCEPGQPRAEALAISGDRILALGRNEEMAPFKTPNTRVIDCENKTLLPGFNDAHCHFFAYLRQLASLDLSPRAVRSIKEMQKAIRHKAQSTPSGGWIRGTNYNEFYLAEKRQPTRRDLDEAAPDHPVIIFHRSLHACVVNSRALQLLGITRETEEPPGGMMERDLETGGPNGMLYEMGEFLRSRIPSALSPNEMDQAMVEADRSYLAAGITSLGEATVTNDFSQWENFRKLQGPEDSGADSQSLHSRVYLMISPESLGEFRQAGLTTGAGNSHLRLGSLKLVLSEARGELHPPQSELSEFVLKAVRLGFQPAIHAVEKSTVLAAVTAIEQAAEHCDITQRRIRIEHCSECPPDLRTRLKKLGVVVVSQPPFLFYHGERYLSQVPAETQPWLYPFKSLLDAGITVAGSSDSPVVPNPPLVGICAAVTRQAESGQVLSPQERLTVEQAIQMYTINAAFASHEESVKGSLSPRKLADIVMLSANPLQVPAEQIRDIKLEMTIIGGEILWPSRF